MLSLGDAENLWEVTWSGFAYTARREFMSLLENEAGSSGTAGAAGAADAGGDVFNLFLPDAVHTDPWAALDRLPRYAKLAKAEAAEVGWRPAA